MSRPVGSARQVPSDPVCWAADIGSIKGKKFGWCRSENGLARKTGSDIRAFAEGVARDLDAGRPVALGFECPLFVPVTTAPESLTAARPGEGARAWSAGAGCGALATGLAETTWVFMELCRVVSVAVVPSFSWHDFRDGRPNLFIWEAFVTGEAKGGDDQDDAVIAAQSFWVAYRAGDTVSAVTAERPFSLVGAALLRSGLTTDISLLSEPCVVIRSTKGVVDTPAQGELPTGDG